jgi:biopolymer transport protein ExbD
LNFNPRRAEDPEISLIPLIDVMLVMVLFFMLSSTFIDEGRVHVQLPQADSRSHDNRSAEPIVVTVTQQGSYRVNERELVNSSRETLRAAVARVAGDARTARVVLRADGRATHQSVVTAMDVLGKMGFARMDIATVEQTATP